MIKLTFCLFFRFHQSIFGIYTVEMSAWNLKLTFIWFYFWNYFVQVDAIIKEKRKNNTKKGPKVTPKHKKATKNQRTQSSGLGFILCIFHCVNSTGTAAEIFSILWLWFLVGSTESLYFFFMIPWYSKQKKQETFV